jgi:hypothetical protein
MKFLIKEVNQLKQQHKSSILIENFSEALEKRLKNRRDVNFQSLVLYLSNSDALKTEHPLLLASKASVVKTGLEMMRRLYTNKPAVASHEEIFVRSEEPNLQERLRMSVGSVQAGGSQTQEHGDIFKKEFDYYDRHGVRGPLLNKFYDAILSAQPTSTQSERNFSLAASIATKKRARMSSEKLNACCFLKSYFLSQK